MTLARRQFAVTLMAGTALTALTVPSAKSQGRIAVLRKIPWGRIVDGVTAAINVVINWFPNPLGPAPQSSTAIKPICNISEADLIDIEFAIQALGLSLSSSSGLNVKDSDLGVIPALSAFSREPDDMHWEKARAILTQFFNNSEILIRGILRIVGPDRQWSRLGLDEKSTDVLKITQTLESMTWAKSEFLKDRNGEGSSSSEGAEDLLQSLKPLPPLIANALQQLEKTTQQRRDANCR